MLHSLITSIIDFFEFGTFGFWALALIASAVFTCAVERQKFALSIIVTILLGVLYYPVIVKGSPKEIGIGIAIYVLVGAIWSVVRWFRHTRKSVERYNNGDIRSFSTLSDEIKVSQHKSEITSWIVFWPWSAGWNIWGDFFSTLFNALKGVYEGISKSALKNVQRKEV